MNTTFRFFMPPMSLMGPGSLQDAGSEIKAMGFSKALIVTDQVLVDIKLVDKLTSVLDANDIAYAIYSGTQPNPTVTNVHDGLDMLKAEGCDFVVSFGGGSPHDCAKGIALVAANGGNIKDYEGVNVSAKPQLPLVAVNTTAGTASEMTIFAIITDEERHVKMAIVDKHTNPIMGVNDPELMVAMPKSLTAATGMDALTHAVEAYVSTIATPITDACALQAIRLIAKYLKPAVDNGEDMVARDKMAYAEYLAGMAFNNASLGYVHAMAHQLGGFYDLPHGVCNAVLLPHVQAYNLKAVPERLADVAEALGVDISNMAKEEAAHKALIAIKELSQSVDIPAGLELLGVKKEDFGTLADNALKDACGLTNPIQATKEEIIAIYDAAF